MTTKVHIGFILALLMAISITGCKSPQIYRADEHFVDESYGSVYEGLEKGDKIIVLSNSNSTYKGRFASIQDEILRVDLKTGQTLEIALTEIQHIRKGSYKATPHKSPAVWFGVAAVVGIILILSMR